MAGKSEEMEFSASFDELTSQYYIRLYPYNLMYDWLTYGDAKSFCKREISFTLKDDVYIRYQDFLDADSFRTEVSKKDPAKIDIGAIYSIRPSCKNMFSSDSFIPIQRELVIDIDMSDYNDVRTCCRDADICSKCWPLMTLAIELLDTTLEEDFDFKHRIWFFSGRRGVHCWVCDEKVKVLPSHARAAIVDYLSIIKSSVDGRIRKGIFSLNPIPMIRRVTAQVVDFFETTYLPRQNIISDQHPKNFRRLLTMMFPDLAETEISEIQNNILFTFHSNNDQFTRWKALKKIYFDRVTKKSTEKEMWHLSAVMCYHCYPRLDANVTKDMAHLIKSPFSVHPKTGKISVPINVSELKSFDPDSVPTVSQLFHEIVRSDASQVEKNSMSDASKCSLSNYIIYLRKIIEKMKQNSSLKQNKSEKSYKSMDSPHYRSMSDLEF